MSTPPAAKFFVNQGVVASRDGHAPPAPAAAQADRHLSVPARARGRRPRHGLGRADRRPMRRTTSTYFTPLAITLNIDSFEHLEFETRPDQLLVYMLVQGDERVIVEFAPIGAGRERHLAVRAAAARVRHVATTSRWSCSGLDVRRGRVGSRLERRRRRPQAPRSPAHVRDAQRGRRADPPAQRLARPDDRRRG